MGDDFSNLRTGDAVLLPTEGGNHERIIRDSLTDKRSYSYQTTVTQTEFVGAAPGDSPKTVTRRLVPQI